ncbi:putative galactose oxidase [Rosa chinensis]|uniref:Putative galactose oxidase n=1 Tax=Rosa chinensis TaxID=74649 RepID=A0A2P6RJN4_ROSCH|nr:aldehyde oxidase GLOX1 [Rosa chinensis]PRQ46649.1 putative galactose oxidase [Rosa chinensis]
MAALHIKLFCILPLLFALGINAQWRGLPFIPNPLVSHHGLGFNLDPSNGGQFQFFDPEPVTFKAAGDKPKPNAGGEPQPDAGGKPNVGGIPKRAVIKAEDVNAVPNAQPQPNFPIGDNPGAWALVSNDAGVSAMHLNVLPNNKAIMYDASDFHISNIKLPNNECLPWKNNKGDAGNDCFAHAVEYDLDKNTVRPLKTQFDAWCSSGGILPDGRFISTGGWVNGYRSARYITACNDGKCDFKEYQNAFAENRWYATQITLADGRVIVVGGRKAYSIEYVPPEGQENKQSIFLPFLDETTDMDENNLYPFVHQSTDGNVFIFANDRSVLLNPKTNKVIKEFPKLDGGSRNYPASGMSALLPIELNEQNPPVIPVDVLVCGGNKRDAFKMSAQKPPVFIPALDDCGRLRITDPNPVWEKEVMPSRRVMGDMLNLPTGELLMINGAMAGASAWWQAEEPNFTPVMYNPKLPNGQRFVKMAPTTIARMYHSTSAVLPNGKILVAGSNTNPGYDFKAKYPTEVRVETFTPPYMDKALDIHRPEINAQASDNKLKYGAPFGVQFKLNEQDKPTKADIKVTVYAVPFTTHGYSMNQRLVVLANTELKAEGAGLYRVTALAPPTGAVAPPGSYLLNVVHRGVPSTGMWVTINQ